MGLDKIGVNLGKGIIAWARTGKGLPAARPIKINIQSLRYAPLKTDVAQISKNTLPKASDLLNIKQFISESPKVIRDNFTDCDVISCLMYDKNGKLIRMNAGFKYDDIERYQLDKKICCYLDDQEQITQALMYDNQSGTIKMVDFISGGSKNYSKAEVEALHYYKYHPEPIHSKLRYGKDLYSGDWKDETLSTIKTLENIFSNPSKVSINNKRRIIYRALQDRLSEDEIKALQKVGGVFADKSFCSATTDLTVAKRFAHNNPILEFELPQGAEYIDMDKIFNIDRQHWLENELLLNENAKFQIIGPGKENNIIKAKYLR